MKNKTKIVLIVLLAIILVMNTLSLAASEPTLTATVSKESVKAGDTFKFSISEKIDPDKKLTGFSFDIKYDTAVLEYETEPASAKTSIWNLFDSQNIGTGNDNVKVMGGSDYNFPDESDVLKMTFKVKDSYTTSNKETTITITPSWDDGNAHNTGYIALPEIKKTIKVNETASSEPANTPSNTPSNTPANTPSLNINPITTQNENTNTNTNTNSNNTNTNTNRNTNNTNTKNTNTNTNNNTSNNVANNTVSSLPKTGSRGTYTLLIIVGLAGIAFASYKGYDKYKNI